jgi:protein-export membrane protein SecD
MRRFLKIKALALLALVVVAVLSVLPSVIPDADENLPEWITETFTRRFNLGLDLQGGLHLEYSVAVDEAIETKLDQVASELEAAFRDRKDIRVRVERDGIDTLQVHFPSPEDVAAATDDVMGVTFGIVERVDPDDGPTEADGVITLKMTKEILNENRNAAVANTLETVRKRVDAMGVAEPNIYPKNRQIVVELPGVSDTETEIKAAAAVASERLQDVLRAAGAPQVVISEVRGEPHAFRVTVPETDLGELLQRTFEGKITEDGLIIDTRLPFELELFEASVEIDEDAATEVIGLSESARDAVLADAGDFQRLLKIIERQAVLRMHLVDDETEFRDTGMPYLEALYKHNMVREGMGISVNVERGYGPGNEVTVEKPYAFYAEDLETLQRYFNNLPAQWRLPADMRVAFGPEEYRDRADAEPREVYRTWIVRARAEVSGEHIVSATTGYHPERNVPVVNVKLDRVGADRFEEMSGNNVGRKMAIVLDELVRSDPVFNERIPGGNVQITLGSGKNVREAANDLVKVLKSGSLSARLQKEFQIRVGADLGRDAVERGFKAFIYGLVAVCLFMLVYYRRSGIIAVTALVMNMVFILAAMAFFGATLTLPGIAGIVLTIGMAVDANVIVFERIREYVREGYTARAAIESGYDRAFTTILDAQLTTAIAGLVLWQYGSGPIRGFAVTLLIGIATSIFTGVWCSRLFFDFQANRRGFDKVSI